MAGRNRSWRPRNEIDSRSGVGAVDSDRFAGADRGSARQAQERLRQGQGGGRLQPQRRRGNRPRRGDQREDPGALRRGPGPGGDTVCFAGRDGGRLGVRSARSPLDLGDSGFRRRQRFRRAGGLRPHHAGGAGGDGERGRVGGRAGARGGARHPQAHAQGARKVEDPRLRPRAGYRRWQNEVPGRRAGRQGDGRDPRRVRGGSWSS